MVIQAREHAFSSKSQQFYDSLQGRDEKLDRIEVNLAQRTLSGFIKDKNNPQRETEVFRSAINAPAPESKTWPRPTFVTGPNGLPIQEIVEHLDTGVSILNGQKLDSKSPLWDQPVAELATVPISQAPENLQQGQVCLHGFKGPIEGRLASNGCIRLKSDAAQALFARTDEHTTVEITDDSMMARKVLKDDGKTYAQLRLAPQPYKTVREIDTPPPDLKTQAVSYRRPSQPLTVDGIQNRIRQAFHGQVTMPSRAFLQKVVTRLMRDNPNPAQPPHMITLDLGELPQQVE